MKALKKRIEVEFVQWTGKNLFEVKSFVGDVLETGLNDYAWKAGVAPPALELRIKTREGDMLCMIGDYIIK